MWQVFEQSLFLFQFPEDFLEPPNFPCLSQLESFTARVMPDSELDQKVRRKARELRAAGGGGGGRVPVPFSSSSTVSPGERGPPSLKSSPLINQVRNKELTH